MDSVRDLVKFRQWDYGRQNMDTRLFPYFYLLVASYAGSVVHTASLGRNERRFGDEECSWRVRSLDIIVLYDREVRYVRL